MDVLVIEVVSDRDVALIPAGPVVALIAADALSTDGLKALVQD